MYTVGKGSLAFTYVLYCIPMRSLAAVAVLTPTVLHATRQPISTSVFSENSTFKNVYGLYSDCTDIEAGRLEETKARKSFESP